MQWPDEERRPTGGETSEAASDRATNLKSGSTLQARADDPRCSECGSPISSRASLDTGLGGKCRARLAVAS